MYGPMKTKWRKILARFKENEGASDNSIKKEIFPQLLKEVLDAMKSAIITDLAAGFKKCGIYPLNAEPLLAELPRAKGKVLANQLVGSSFVEYIEDKHAKQVENKAVPKRKRLPVVAGKSISEAEIQGRKEQEDVVKKVPKKRTKKAPKKEPKKPAKEAETEPKKRGRGRPVRLLETC